MSAESPKRTHHQLSSSGEVSIPTVIPPQAVSDRSIIESVAGFINEVALTQSPPIDAKEQIIWTRFETDADISDLSSFGEDWDLEDGCAPPLILTLGYGTGIQMWAIPANGEAIEILSWRHGGPVKCLKILPTPILDPSDQTNPITDLFGAKRPLMALCDASCKVNFISLKDGDSVKIIKFKHPILDILANRTTVAVTFQERIAVFDARTFEDRSTVTTCFPSPGLNPNPVALGSRWIAYAEFKLIPSKRSNGGYDGFGGISTMATVINAAKTLGKGLKGIGETIGLTGQVNHGGIQSGQGVPSVGGVAGLSPSSSSNAVHADGRQAGIVTIMDIKYPIKEISPTTGTPVTVKGNDPVIAHFIAHTDPIVNLAFDPSGMLLLTSDKRGHDFHLFRVYPHPGGPSLASAHHLYVLHRGDTTAKVQDIAFSMDSRWVAVSSLRGTTHVFPITPYGGALGIRTHGSPHVVNQLSRFHRSAGLSVDGRSSSPITYGDNQSGPAHHNTHNSTSHQNGQHQGQHSHAYTNPRIPPFPHPTTVLPLTQLRQPYSLSTSTPTNQSPHAKVFNVSLSRQRTSSLSDDSMMGSGQNPSNPLRVCATFARPRAWLLEPPGITRETSSSARNNKSMIDSLFIMASHGSLIQYDLEPKHVSNIARDKVCDDTPVELFVEPKAQWNLLRSELKFNEIQAPLPVDNWLLKNRLMVGRDEKMDSTASDCGDKDDRWLSQVEIITHAGPHRRLWMGPQFIFKTYNTPSGAPLQHIDMEAVEIGLGANGNAGIVNGGRPARSNPVNMPNTEKPIVPVLIESGSYSSYEQSPRLSDQYRVFEDDDFTLEPRESQLREDLADAMRECPAGMIHNKDSGGPSLSSSSSMSSSLATNNPRQHDHHQRHHSSDDGLALENNPLNKTTGRVINTSIENIVNPLGTVTTVVKGNDSMNDSMNSDSSLSRFISDHYIHENCDEALFRPVITVVEKADDYQSLAPIEAPVKPTIVSRNLIVPVEIESSARAKEVEQAMRQKTETDDKEVVAKNPVEVKMDETAVEVEKEVEIRATGKGKQNKNKRNKNDDKEKSVEKTIITPSDREPTVEMKKEQSGNNGNKKTTSKKLKKNVEATESEFVLVTEKDNQITAPRPLNEKEKPPVEDFPPIELETSFTVQLRRKSSTSNTSFDQLMKQTVSEERFKVASKQDFEIIQDSLMKDTVLTAGTRNKGSKTHSVSEVNVKAPITMAERLKETRIFDISDTKLNLEEVNECGQEEDMYTDPLVPLEPFDPTSFESLEFSKTDDQCLMTFDSPSMNEEDDETMVVPELENADANLKEILNGKNLIFALCTSLREGEEDGDLQNENENLGENDPGLELVIDENYMDMDSSQRKRAQSESLRPSPVLTASTGSSEEEISSRSSDSATTTTASGKQTTGDEEEGEDEIEVLMAKAKSSPDDDDEELRPLLKNTGGSRKEVESGQKGESDKTQTESVGKNDIGSEPQAAEGAKQQPLQPQQQQQSKKKSHHVDGVSAPVRDGRGALSGTTSLDSGAAAVLAEELSSSSFSSTSRASFDAPSSSPTASYNGENNLLHFHGDSSGSL